MVNDLAPDPGTRTGVQPGAVNMNVQALKEAQLELLAVAGEERMSPKPSTNRLLEICAILETIIEKEST